MYSEGENHFLNALNLLLLNGGASAATRPIFKGDVWFRQQFDLPEEADSEPVTFLSDGWLKGTCYKQTFAGGTGCKSDYESTSRTIIRLADLMRYVRAGVYHHDLAGTYLTLDNVDDRNQPDFSTTGEYLRKYDMGQRRRSDNVFRAVQQG